VRCSGAVTGLLLLLALRMLLAAGGFDPDDEGLVLDRAAHAKYLHGGLGQLPSGAPAMLGSWRLLLLPGQQIVASWVD